MHNINGIAIVDLKAPPIGPIVVMVLIPADIVMEEEPGVREEKILEEAH